VRAGDAGRVHVVGTIRARSSWGIGTAEAQEKVRRLEANPPLVQNGNVIRIGRVDAPELGKNVSISYELVVPAETKLGSETGSRSQTVVGIRGPVRAKTGSGSLAITNIGSEVRAETGSGSIELAKVKGRLVASTGSGSIRAVGIAGATQASAGSGSVRLELASAGDVEIETGSGGVEVSGVRGALRVVTGSGSITALGEPAGSWKVSTGSGGISVKLPSDAGFELEANTSSGRIYSEHPITLRGSIGKRELRGTVRGGGVLVALLTGSGNIRIE